MPDRIDNILKILCAGLAALLLVKAAHLVTHLDPLGQAAIPPLPKLTVPAETNNAATNSVAKEKTGETNKVAVAGTATKDTNSVPRPRRPRRGGNMGPGMGGPPPPLNLPAAIQARVDRIKESEILGPFIRPMPMALLGIADDDAFLRAPNGQTGVVKEGDELGGVKLLRIGVNRVLVEQDGEKKELTVFDGFGGESLLPKETNTSTNVTVTNATPVSHPKEHP